MSFPAKMYCSMGKPTEPAYVYFALNRGLTTYVHRPVKIAQNLSSPFLAATLKVFRNNLSNDLRFHWKVGYDSETYWSESIIRESLPP